MVGGAGRRVHASFQDMPPAAVPDLAYQGGRIPMVDAGHDHPIVLHDPRCKPPLLVEHPPVKREELAWEKPTDAVDTVVISRRCAVQADGLAAFHGQRVRVDARDGRVVLDDNHVARDRRRLPPVVRDRQRQPVHAVPGIVMRHRAPGRRCPVTEVPVVVVDPGVVGRGVPVPTAAPAPRRRHVLLEQPFAADHRQGKVIGLDLYSVRRGIGLPRVVRDDQRHGVGARGAVRRVDVPPRSRLAVPEIPLVRPDRRVVSGGASGEARRP